VFFTVTYFHPSPIFLGNAKSVKAQSGTQKGNPCLQLLVYGRSDTLAHRDAELITVVTSFIVVTFQGNYSGQYMNSEHIVT
jgi:hypothetical protein